MSFYALWCVFHRVSNVALYEVSRLVEHKAPEEHGAAWQKIRQVFSQTFGCGPRINRSLVLALTPDCSKFYCPITNSEELFDEIYRDKVYDRFFEPGEVSKVVDVGAHVGAYTLRAARKVGKKGIVVSIEPDPLTFRILVANVKMNDLDQVVIPFNIALANFVGKTRLYVNPKDRWGNSLVPFGQMGGSFCQHVRWLDERTRFRKL